MSVTELLASNIHVHIMSLMQKGLQCSLSCPRDIVCEKEYSRKKKYNCRGVLAEKRDCLKRIIAFLISE